MENKDKEKPDIFKVPIILMALQGVIHTYGGISWVIAYLKQSVHMQPGLRYILLQLGLGILILSSSIGLMKNKRWALWSTTVIYSVLIALNSVILLIERTASSVSMSMMVASLMGSAIPAIFIVMLLKNKERFNC